MILQTDERIKNEWIHKYGCAFMSVLFLANKKKKTKMSPAKIDIYFEQMKAAGCFTPDMDIIWGNAFAFFGLKVKVTIKDDPKYKLKKGEFSIGKYYNEATKFSHFCVAESSVCCYDPIGESITVRDGELVSYRVFKEIK